MTDRLSHLATRLLATSLLVALVSVADAHNGSLVATSVVDGVTVDGDSSDWPADLPWHPVGLNLYGDAETSVEDCSARFRIALDEANLKVYALVEVRDDSFVPRPKVHSWTSNDAFDVFVAVPNLTRPNKAEGANQVALHSEFVSRYDTSTKTHVYESSFDLREAGYADLRQPISAALTVSYSDKDEDGSFTVKFWSPFINKAMNPSRRGDLVICGSNCGQLKGKLTRGLGLDDVGRLLLNFRAIDAPLLNVNLRTEPGGSYQLQLPEGRYERSGVNLPTVTLEIRDGETSFDSIEYTLPPRRALSLAEFDAPANTHPSFETLSSKPKAQRYEMNKLNGLPDSRINALAQDSSGTLWIGTGANLARYDGTRLSVFEKEFARNTLRFWHDRKRNQLWLAGKFEFGFVSDGYLTEFPLFEQRRAVCVGPTHDDRVCIGTRTGLFLWDDEHFQYQGTADGLPDELVKAVLSDPNRGVTWIGTNMGLVAFDGQNYKLYDQHGLDDPRIVSLFLDSKGRLWVGTASSLYYYEGENFQLVRKHETERVEYARSFVELENGAIKVGAYNELLDIPPDFPQTEYTIQPESSPCNALLLDQDQQLWMGFGDGELRREDRGLRQRYTIDDGKCRYLYSIGDQLWFLQQTPKIGGSNIKWTAVRLDTATYEATLFPLIIPAPAENDLPLEVTNFFATKNGVWCGTKAHGVLELRDGQWASLELATESYSEIASMAEDSQQRLWICTRDELFRREDGKTFRLSLPPMPVSARLLHVGQSPGGRMMIGTTEGIFVVDDEMQIVDRLHESTGMLSNVPRAIKYSPDGTMWIATFSGLQSIKGDKTHAYNASNGMLDDRPSSFVTIWGDEVWCGSHAGINRISVSSGVVQHLLGNDGLGENQICGTTVVDDSMWLCGDCGVWQYRRGTSPPHLSIAEVSTTRSLGRPDKIAVTTDVKRLKVDLLATSLKTRTGGMIYQYKMDDGTWKKTEPHVDVPVPTRGKHQIRFRAIDRDLLISDTRQISIRVSPPYARWLKNLALVAATVASMVLGLLYFVRIRSEKSDLEQSVKEQSAQLSDLERQLQHSEKMKALGTLATGVAHDFNNSLLAINGNAELALMSETIADKDELISEVLAVTNQAADLTRSMLMFGGKSTTKKQTVDLNVPILEAEKILRRTLPAAIQFECNVSDEPIYCEADPGQIQQVVVNLALNAKDAMPKGGLLKLRLDKVANNARIVVSDGGCGMSEETQARIFEPFYTEKPRGQGTGLGLAMVHAIVGDHGGEISVNSAVGKGSAFRIVLPSSDHGSDSVTEDAPAKASSQNANGGRVLLADDEPHVRATLAKGLSQAGFEVETVGDGSEFVQLAKLAQFDLVVVDVDMPGENGWDGLDKVRETHTDHLAIVISGLPSGEHRIDERTTAFLRKPFSIRKLTDTATKLLADAK